MEATGMPFDVEAAREKQQVNDCEQETLHRRLVAFTNLPDFNPGSADQVARFLYTDIWKAEVKFAIPRLVKMSKEEKLAVVQQVAPEGTRVTRVGRDYAYGEKWLDGMGLKPPKRDKKQKTARPSVNSKKLTVLHGTNPWVVNYLDWRRHEKMAGYLRDWIARAHEGQLYARFDQSGTATGRLAGREPNLQQVATEGPYRALFRGPLVIGDYAGLEARLAAHFSGDPGHGRGLHVRRRPVRDAGRARLGRRARQGESAARPDEGRVVGDAVRRRRGAARVPDRAGGHGGLRR
jgi:hypothetical protein